MSLGLFYDRLKVPIKDHIKAPLNPLVKAPVKPPLNSSADFVNIKIVAWIWYALDPHETHM